MNANSWLFLIWTATGGTILWLLAPGLATVLGVVLGLFAIASWKEGAKTRNMFISNNIDDFKQRVSVALPAIEEV
jgi:hypothetical protein